MKIGYARVSTEEQNLERQIEELKRVGCEKVFFEKQSGKDFNRPEYQRMRGMLRFGDVLFIHELSRFGRSAKEIKDEWEYLINNEVDIVVLNMPLLDTRKYKELDGLGRLISDIVLQLLSWMVEEERLRMKTAQREGIEIAKKQGKYKGKKIKYHENAKGRDKLVYDAIVNMLANNEPIMEIRRVTGLSRNTIYKIKNRLSNDEKS